MNSFKVGDKVLILPTPNAGPEETSTFWHVATVISELTPKVVYPRTAPDAISTLKVVHDIRLETGPVDLNRFGPCAEPRYLRKLPDDELDAHLRLRAGETA